MVTFSEKNPNILQPNLMLKCHCFYLALQPNLHQDPISSLCAPQGSSWQEVPDAAAATLPGVIYE